MTPADRLCCSASKGPQRSRLQVTSDAEVSRLVNADAGNGWINGCNRVVGVEVASNS